MEREVVCCLEGVEELALHPTGLRLLDQGPRVALERLLQRPQVGRQRLALEGHVEGALHAPRAQLELRVRQACV